MLALPVLLLALAASATPAKSPKDQTVKLAAPGLQAVNLPKEKAEAFMEHFNHQLTERRIRVITAKEVNAVLGLARTQQLMGCPEEESSCMMELADALGVDGLVSGTIGKYGPSYQASLTIVSSGDARLLSSVTARGDSEAQLIERLTAAAWTAASEVGGALQRPTRKYVQNAVSIDLVSLTFAGAASLSYQRAVADRWSLRGEFFLSFGQQVPLSAGGFIEGSEIDVELSARHHFFDLAPLGLYVGGGLIMAVLNASGTAQTGSGLVEGVFASTGFALTAEVGYAYALFDALYLQVGLSGLLGAGRLVGMVTGSPRIESYYPAVAGRVRASVGFAF
jgi:hypothetical protein